MAGVRAGSEADLQDFVALVFHRLRCHCHRRLVRFHVYGIVDADDITNDILQHVIRKIQSNALSGVCDLSSLEKWLNLEIRQRTAKASRRYRKDAAHFQRDVEAILEDSMGAVADSNSVADIIDESDHLRGALSILPHELRSIARLHLIRCTQVTIARQLGVSVKTVSRKLKLIYDVWRNQLT